MDRAYSEGWKRFENSGAAGTSDVGHFFSESSSSVKGRRGLMRLICKSHAGCSSNNRISQDL